MSKVEILSPAGNMESFKAAIAAGANAIYMGVSKFNARTMAKNFDIDEYIECIRYAHKRNVKVYLTLNTLVFDEEIKEALEVVLELYSKGLDAVILQDIGLAKAIHELIPKLPMHASTQMSVFSLGQVKYLEKLGFSRVVLARELTIEEIKYICANTHLEIEVFVHGALCVSVSGQCLMSEMIGNRSANRGNCAQPCRLKYSLYNSSKKTFVKSKHLLSRKDIYGLDLLSDLVKAGVTSLKIEGRNKTPEYVYLTTAKYRKYIDIKNKVSKLDEKELLQIFNRSGKSDGYLTSVKRKEAITENTPKNTGLVLGDLISSHGNFVKVKLTEDLDLHDGIEIYIQDTCITSTIVTCIKDEKGKIINRLVKAGSIVYIGEIKAKIPNNSVIYKTSSNSLNKSIREFIEKKDDKYKLHFNISLVLKKDKEASFKILNKDKGIELIGYSEVYCKEAVNLPLKVDRIKEALSNTTSTPYIFDVENLEMDNSIFLSMSSLNTIKRDICKTLDEYFNIDIDITKELEMLDTVIERNSNLSKNVPRTSVQSLFIYEYDNNIDYTNKASNGNVDRIYVPVNCLRNVNINDIIKKYEGIDIFIYLPNIIGNNLEKYINSNLEEFCKSGVKGFLLGSTLYIDRLLSLKDKYDIVLIADYSLNISNSLSASWYLNNGFDCITLLPNISNATFYNFVNKFNFEVIDNNITVMTSRYCVIGSFVSDGKNRCNAVCKKDSYILVDDDKGIRYRVVCDGFDCFMYLVREFDNKIKKENVKLSIRENI